MSRVMYKVHTILCTRSFTAKENLQCTKIRCALIRYGLIVLILKLYKHIGIFPNYSNVNSLLDYRYLHM